MRLFDWKTARLLTLVLPLALAASACGSDPVEPDDEIGDRIGLMTVVVGSQTITFNGAAVTGAPITLSAGSSQQASVTVTDLDGKPLTLSSDFELRIIPENTTIASFQSTGALTGTLRGLKAGQTGVRVQLFHIEDDHPEFEFVSAIVVQ